MRNKILLLPLLFVCQFIFAQKQVTNLHYKWIEKNPKKPEGVLKYEFNFNWNPETQIFVADKVNEKGKIYPRHIIDQKRKIIVVQMEKRNEYLLEESDSFWFNKKVKLELAEEGAKEIKGFKCKGYTFSTEFKLNAGGPFTGASIMEDYTLWVTEDLKFNDECNSPILALLRTQSAQGADFNGVLVQLDYKMSFAGRVFNNEISLDMSKLDQKPEVIKWPWESSDGVAWLEMPQLNHGTTLILRPGWTTAGGPGWRAGDEVGGVYRKGDGSVAMMNTRLKLLLKEITGQDKPKTKIEFFQNIFGVGPWGN